MISMICQIDGAPQMAEALAYHYPPAALLYPPKTLQTALASTHAYKPAHTLFLPSSLFGAAAPSPLSRIRLPLPVLDLFLSPRQRFSCLTASPPPAPYLGLCTFVPCPAQPRARWLAMDLAVVQCRRQTVAASGSNQRCERSYYCPPGTSTEYLPTCHHYMRTPRLALFFGSHAHHCASREVLGAPCKMDEHQHQRSVLVLRVLYWYDTGTATVLYSVHQGTAALGSRSAVCSYPLSLSALLDSLSSLLVWVPESSTPDWTVPLRAGLGLDLHWRRCMIGHPGRYVPRGCRRTRSRAAAKTPSQFRRSSPSSFSSSIPVAGR
ncbi:hypothetical protein Trihar35433_380 [Trichoderma harzianum]|nr:hypothetical protein Trihar35433_380 [Trichoderma harzianum]